jgi:hypothetical protein
MSTYPALFPRMILRSWMAFTKGGVQWVGWKSTEVSMKQKSIDVKKLPISNHVMVVKVKHAGLSVLF